MDSILLIITGGIAACKALDMVRLLRKRGHAVQCVLTKSAEQFVTPLSLETLSGNRVATDLFDLTTEHEIGHIRLSRQADRIMVVPATANFLAKMAHGLADDLASTVALAADKPLWFAPAMNVKMWDHPATQRNIKQLTEDGHSFVGPDSGDMACGEYGYGRMSEPQAIIDAVFGARDQLLKGLKAVVTVGATQEPIDPVRYISNRSSGQQGRAIARALHQQGATVHVVAGTTVEALSGTHHTACVTGQNMLDAVQDALPCDLFIGCAAVSDWRANDVAAHKMKKQSDTLTLELVQNPDILATISQLPVGQRPSLVVGFAAETQDVIANAKAKRTRKGCDWIVANDVSTDVMGGTHNTASLITADTQDDWPRMDKDAVARALVRKIIHHFESTQTSC